jgi:hypothetical protein
METDNLQDAQPPLQSNVLFGIGANTRAATLSGVFFL